MDELKRAEYDVIAAIINYCSILTENDTDYNNTVAEKVRKLADTAVKIFGNS